VVLAAQGWRLYDLKTALAKETARVATLRDTAAAARAEAESQNAIGTARMADMERLARENRRLPLLADLTRVLGDEIWVSNFALEGDILRLSGFSEIDMAQVVAAIRPLPWVAGVELDGAVTLDDASGARRFLLNVELAKGGGE
jgi:Tfp pilus assembly protein PilN